MRSSLGGQFDRRKTCASGAKLFGDNRQVSHLIFLVAGLLGGFNLSHAASARDGADSGGTNRGFESHPSNPTHE